MDRPAIRAEGGNKYGENQSEMVARGPTTRLIRPPQSTVPQPARLYIVHLSTFAHKSSSRLIVSHLCEVQLIHLHYFYFLGLLVEGLRS